jgi:filamentous hemagglutinin
MNTQRHRLIFNRARGMLMAVAETAASHTRSPGGTAVPVHPPAASSAASGVSLARLRPTAFAALVALGAGLVLMPVASAQIVAYKPAPASQQPTVLTAGNGVPLINIQMPSAAGVSRNTYEQFDVQPQGAILNNSRTNVQTQLGGWVQGNPSLTGGSARIILNEVISANPSQLMGYVEVAGSPAQVVVANPSGVTCNGCGFINASRATLTTGTPTINGGSLDGYRVTGGTIRIEGAGMDTSRVGYTDLIARAVEVNAGLWAQTLKVTAGTNQVNADNSQATPIAGVGSAPAFAIDVAQLGGMYAGKIVLVGTEAGVGVRSAGTLGASAGEILVTADGRLTNTGSISSAGQTRISVTDGMVNTGTIYAKGNLVVSTPAAIDNAQGTLAADGNVDIRSVGLDNTQGTIGSALGNVAVDTGNGTLGNRSGMIVAALDISLKANGLNNTDAAIAGRNVGIDTQGETFDNTRGSLVADGMLDVQSGALKNSRGLIQAGGAMRIDTHGETLSNTLSGTAGGIVGQGTVSLTTGTLDNTSGFIGAKDQLSLTAIDIGNAGGTLTGEHDILVAGTRLDNRGGQIPALGAVDVQVSGAANNSGGLIRAGQTVRLTADSLDNSNTQGVDQGIEGRSVTISARQISNATGAMRADQDLTLTSRGSIDNTGGLISSAQTLQMLDPNAVPGSNASTKTLAITNTGGTLIADRQLTVDAASLTGDGNVLSQGDLAVKLLADFTQSGRFAANGNATLETAGMLANRARIQAGNRLSLKAASIDNAATGEIVASTVGLTATDTHTLTNRGLIDGQDTFIDSPTVNNLGTGRIYGDHIAIAATTLNNEAETVAGITSAPVIAARTRLDIGATTVNNREQALLFSAGDLAIGGSLDASHRATGQADTVNNISAGIEALGDLSIATGTLNNQRSTFSSERQLDPAKTSTRTWTRCDDPPDCDYISYLTDQTTVYKDVVTSTSPAAFIRAGGNMALAITTLSNQYSTIAAGGNLDLVGSTLTNLGAELFEQTDIVHSGYYRHWGRSPKGFWSSSESSSVLIDSVPAVISAGGSLTGSYTGRIDNITLREHTAPLVASTGTRIAALGVGSITEVAASAGAAGATIRTAAPNTTLPSNSLFHTNPNPGGNYLIETDPKFASYRKWLSSDYMLKALALDPATTQKRLGDGFYEQRLINEQVGQLTGRRFLAGYTNEEDQYRALMGAGVTYAQAHQLRPGVALSAEQMAALTTDIVWLVEKEVTLVDGRVQKVLVPQLYVRLQEGDLAPSGALLAGNTINLATGHDLTTSGTIAGRQLVSLTAENIRNLGGRISGQQTVLTARQDIQSLGGTIEARDRLVADAGRDLTVASSTVDLDLRYSGKGGNATLQKTVVDRVAGLYVTGAGGTLIASAGNDMNLLGAVIANNAAGTGTTTLVANNNLNLGTVTESSNTVAAGRKSRRSEVSSSEVGTVIQTGGDLTLAAGQDLTARAANVSSNGAILAQAGRDLSVTAGQTTYDMVYDAKSSKSGFLSKSSKTRHDEVHDTSAIASTFSGDSVTLVANRDIGVKGSNVVATNDVAAIAGRNLSIEAATETHSETHLTKTSKRGAYTSGASVTVGSRKDSVNQQTESTTAAKSTIGSTDGNVLLLAGEAYRQVGSDVIAPKGNIDIVAKQVDIVEARETSRTVTEQKSKQSGLTLAVSSPVITAVQTAQQMSQAAADTKDGRMKALAVANTALAGKTAADAVATGMAKANADTLDQLGGIGINVSIGGSKSSSKTTQTSNTAVASNLKAGQDLTISASGAGKDSDITLQGAKAAAAKNLTLSAEDEIRLLAASNTATQTSTNKSSSGSIGVGFNTTTGFAITASASQGKGKSNGSDQTWSNTELEAGNKLTLESGGDTTLKGAVARGEQIVANVGGNLGVESLQDTSTYKNKQQSASVSLSVPVAGGLPSGSVGGGNSRITSDYASVTEQSGLRAGDGGFQVDVKGNTDLKGGAITSTQKAIDTAKNSFNTGGELTTSDIRNKADYDGKAIALNIGTGFNADGSLAPQGTSAGFGKDSGSASSTTQAAISGIAGNQNARTGDAETGIAKIFDQQKVQKEIDAQVKITQVFGQSASKAVGDYADTKLKEAQALRDQGREQEAKDIESQWGANGTLRLAAHTVIGGLTGGASGAAGAAAGTLTAPAVAEALAKAGIDGPLATAITAAASTAVGAVVGGTAGAGTALNEVANNFLKHSEAVKADAARKRLANCTSDACRNEAQKEIDFYTKLSADRDDALRSACAENPAGANCQAQIALAKDAARSYQGQGIPRYSVLGDYAAQAARMADTPHYQPEALRLLAARIGMPVVATTAGAAIVSIAQIIGYCATNPAACNAAGIEIGNLLAGEALPAGVGATAGAKATKSAIDESRVANGFYRDGSIADPSKTMSATGNWKPAWEVTTQEANSLVAERLPNGAAVTERVPANALNAKITGDNPTYSPPYVPNTETVTFTTTQADRYVRVYVDRGGSGQAGEWLMRASDIEGLSATQIASKYALPQVPNMITDATIPAGQSLRASIANDVQIRQGIGGNGGGGGVQFEVLIPKGTEIPSSWFSNPRAL